MSGLYQRLDRSFPLIKAMKTILVIEDEPLLRQTIIEILEKDHYRIIEAENGQKGLDCIQTVPVDLVICDIVMPELDGYEVLTQVRSRPGTAPIPFIFLTAKSEKPDIRHGIELGADDYLTKPFTQTELLNAVKARLEKQAIVHQQYQQKLEALRGQLSTYLPHELLTPVDGIINLSSYLTNYASILKAEEISDIASLMCRSAQRIERTIQNSLLYAKLRLDIQNQHFSTYQHESCDCSENAITSAAMAVAQRAQRTVNLSLQRSNQPVLISHTHLKKIIEELVDNACKFSPAEAAIDITSDFQASQFVLEVVDRGQGMTPMQINNIGAYVQFERKFYEQQGTGLGLVIVRQLTELHNGKLVIESCENGTTMRVILPVPLP